jgi:hypothetical protein
VPCEPDGIGATKVGHHLKPGERPMKPADVSRIGGSCGTSSVRFGLRPSIDPGCPIMLTRLPVAFVPDRRLGVASRAWSKLRFFAPHQGRCPFGSECLIVDGSVAARPCRRERDSESRTP